MSQSLNNNTSLTVRFDSVQESLVATEQAGLRVEPFFGSPTQVQSQYLRLLSGQNYFPQPANLMCSAAEIAPPPTAANQRGSLDDSMLTSDEIKSMWDQVIRDSSNQNTLQSSREDALRQEEKIKKLELLLKLALSSGNIELAMLLLSSLDTTQSNQISKNLMMNMQSLQDKRKAISNQMATLGGDTQSAPQVQKLNNDITEINTEISLLQTLLQDVNSHKRETQELASNFLKSRHDTSQAIIRNMA